jgi:hypothetical protein
VGKRSPARQCPAAISREINSVIRMYSGKGLAGIATEESLLSVMNGHGIQQHKGCGSSV